MMVETVTARNVLVTVKLTGRLRTQLQEFTWQFYVAPELAMALQMLATELERRGASEFIQGCLVILNDRNVQTLAPKTRLYDGDLFMIVPPIAGGS